MISAHWTSKRAGRPLATERHFQEGWQRVSPSRSLSLRRWMLGTLDSGMTAQVPPLSSKPLPIRDVSRTDWPPLLCPSPIPFVSVLFLFSPQALSSICQDSTGLYNQDTRAMSAFRKSRIQGINEQH